MVVIIVIFNHCCCCRRHKLAHLVSVKFTDIFSLQIHTHKHSIALCFSVSWFYRNSSCCFASFYLEYATPTNNGTVVCMFAEMGIESRKCRLQHPNREKYMVQWHWILVTVFGFSFKRSNEENLNEQGERKWFHSFDSLVKNWCDLESNSTKWTISIENRTVIRKKSLGQTELIYLFSWFHSIVLLRIFRW